MTENENRPINEEMPEEDTGPIQGDPHDQEAWDLAEETVEVEAEFEPTEAADEIDPDISSDDRLWSALAYVSQFLVPIIIPVVMLLSEQQKERKFQRFHAVHALTLAAVSVLYEIVAIIVYAILSAISAGCFACILWPIFMLPIVLFVYYAYEAYQGEYIEVPYLTEFLREQGWL